MKNIFAAICLVVISLNSISCREQEEMITSSEAESLQILKQATDDSNTTVAPAIDSEGDPVIPPKR